MNDQIRQCMSIDQFALRRDFARLRVITDADARDKASKKLQQRIAVSIARAQARQAKLPRISYPAELPVSEKRAEIAAALKQHQIIVVAGETGSGKTTQIPKICLELGYGVRGLIGHTQPRRLAARSVASRIAEELGETLGQGVGYQVRFSDNTTENTFIKLMTDGILLAEIQQDRYLNKYDVLIIDEAHERSLNIDFLLGYLKRLSRQRPELKIIITSATIDVEKFSSHFSGAPIVSVSGRTYPVEILYQDPAQLQADDADEDILYAGVVQALKTLERLERERRQPAGDVLIFLSGERDIRELALSLRKLQLKHTEILPLYARLTQNEQQRIFASHPGRRIILSTNVAETSLTVPGIRYVIDSGLARISRYSLQSKVQRLPIEPISQASANQRAGRCGRVASGICIRLYSENDFLCRALFTDPEIQRTNLSAVILQMLLLKLGDISQFPFVEMPERKAINDGFRLLDELGAITPERELTASGRAMARLPADPRLARMLLESLKPTGRKAASCLYEMLIIVSALSVQDPRDTPADKRQAARERHQQFAHPESDFLSWVKLWQQVERERQSLNQNQFRKYCKENFLSWLRLREWRETHRQLTLACQDLGYKVQRIDADDVVYDSDYEAVHRAMLAGSLNQLGQRSQDGFYLGSRGRKFSLFPSSALSRKNPRWILSAELIETSRLFATMAARIEPEWAVDVAQHLLKRDYFEPHWEKKRGEVVAFEKVSVFGLVLIEKRPVSFASVDPVLSREIFIREALVAEALETRATFYARNTELIANVRRQEEKERKPDILISDDELAAFYDARLPASIYSTKSLERWCQDQAKSGNDPLLMLPEHVISRDVSEDSAVYFPDHARVKNNPLLINYRFSPGSEDDGISINVPEALLASLSQADLDWAVPGLVHQRCVALIKALPKALRKLFVPVPEFVSQVLGAPEAQAKPPLVQLLTEQSWRLKRIRIAADSWDERNVASHLRPRIRLLNGKLECIELSDDLTALQANYAKKHNISVSSKRHALEANGMLDWSFGDLPTLIEIQDSVHLIRYPALQDVGDTVSIVLCDSPVRAQFINQRGLARLLMLRTVQQKNMIIKHLQRLKQTLGLKLVGHDQQWQEHAISAIYRLSFGLSEQRPVNRAEFDKVLEAGRSELVGTAERVCRLLSDAYNTLFDVRRQLERLAPEARSAVKDINDQLTFLFPDDFPASVPDAWLWEYPRYLKSLDQRLTKLLSQAVKDNEHVQSLRALDNAWQCLPADRREQLSEFPWWLQELRVSLFAQTLGTRLPVSERRLRKRLEELAR